MARGPLLRRVLAELRFDGLVDWDTFELVPLSEAATREWRSMLTDELRMCNARPAGEELVRRYTG